MKELMNMNRERTIKSVELVKIINNFRKLECNKSELRHCDFMAKIRKELETLKSLGLGGQRNFSLAKYSDEQGKLRDCYELDKKGMRMMLNSESTLVRYKTEEYIEKLETEIQNKDSYMIQDPVERAKRWIEEQEEKQAIERKAQALLIENEDLKPKGEFYDKVTQTKDLIDLGQATQLLKLPYGRNILFRVLRDRKILKTGGANHNQPYQSYVDRGYFSLVETDKIVYGEVKKKTVVTQKGLDYLRKILC